VPVSTVKEWAGQADISTTNMYVTFLRSDADREGVARLERTELFSESGADGGGTNA
jgi:hypothetical protein